MTRAAAAVFLSWCLASGPGGASRPAATTPAAFEALRSWVDAVNSHVPGRRDASLITVSSLTYEQRSKLNDALPLFLNYLLAKGGPTRTESERNIAASGIAARKTPGPDAFLKRAAVLHSDAAVAGAVTGAVPRAPVANSSRGPVSPLLSDRPIYLDKDGEIVGEAYSNWNWPFARSLLDLVGANPGPDPFVAIWYHATAAVMLQKGWYAEASSHLAHAATTLPVDPQILFDRATYAEIQGLPVHQVLLSDDDLVALRTRRFGRPSLGGAGTQRVLPLGIPPPEVANEEAERLFRRTLTADPSFVEARVRLGRLLFERKRYEEAARELDTALAAKPAGVVAFYAQLFAGRTGQALGRITDAAGHYRDADALFPGAQSALLAQSQVALLSADVAAALEPIARIERLMSRVPTDDPWWVYHLAAGRDADVLLRAMWARLDPGSGLSRKD
jgi:tetratricopeptide (TPR) repeat protein